MAAVASASPPRHPKLELPQGAPNCGLKQPDIDYQPDEAKWGARTARRLAEDPSLLHTPLPEGFPRVLASPLVWEGKDWTNESQWVHTLTPEQLKEIDDTLKYFLGLALPISQIDEETFPLPKLGPILKGLARELHAGRGFFVLRTIPVDTYTRGENIIVYTGLSAYIANLRGIQDKNGVVIGHIKDLSGIHPMMMLGAPAYTTDKQPFHSDPGDIVSLFALEVAAEGGVSKVSSSWRVYNELVETRPDLIQTLTEPFPLEMYNGNPRYRWRSILHCEDGKIIIQNARRLCTGFKGLPRSGDIPPITEAQAESLDALHFLAEKHHLKLNFQKGDIQYINNLSMFHARDAFIDTQEKRRHLVRFWLRNEDLGWKIPPALEARWRQLYQAVTRDEQRFPSEPEIRSASRGHSDGIEATPQVQGRQ